MGKNCLAILGLAVGLLAGCSSSKEVTTTAAVPVNVTTEVSAPADDSVPGADEEKVEEDILESWMHLNGDDGAYVGVGTQMAYEMLLKNKKPLKKVVVAVIDSGVDIKHEDISPWTNDDEIPDNGIDDDKNGYVDDVYGWNFIGGADGENIYYDTFEVTREYVRMRNMFEGVDTDSLSAEQQKDYAYFLQMEEDYNNEVEEMTAIFNNINSAAGLIDAANSIMGDFLETSDFTIEQVNEVESPREEVQQAKSIILYFDQLGLDQEQILEAKEAYEGNLEKGLNPDFDPRGIVGDNYSDTTEKYYGNNNVTGPDAYHGTHVAGIIGARRDNAIGIDGIANSVEIMAVRAVPKGDERDKDIANAIRYAVDNGADIINMSFGKNVSPQKAVVDEAIRYAESKDVLMIHASGNDGVNNDSTLNFPTPKLPDGSGRVNTWLEVGASSWEGPQHLAASFSNYGKMSVDVFAPGVAIYSTAPENKYKSSDGTSMASPVVAGLAALVMAYYPQFSAAEIKDILLESAASYADRIVTKPGTESTLVPFGSLSRTGSIVNAYGALRMAEEKANAAGTP